MDVNIDAVAVVVGKSGSKAPKSWMIFGASSHKRANEPLTLQNFSPQDDFFAAMAHVPVMPGFFVWWAWSTNTCKWRRAGIGVSNWTFGSAKNLNI